MRDWLRGVGIWAVSLCCLYVGVLVLTPLWNWIVDPYTANATHALWAIGAVAVVVFYLADSRARMVNRDNRGRYDGGIDNHKP